MTRQARAWLRAALAGAVAALVVPMPAAGAADPPVTRLAGAYRYTAVGDPALFTFVQTGGEAVDDEEVELWDRRGRVATAPLEPAPDGVRVAELRVADLPAGVHRLKACSASACASTVHIVFDGVVDGVVAALLGRRATARERTELAGRPAEEIAQAVAASPERHAGIVRELYHFHLGRPPDLAGLLHWILFLRRGGSATDMALALCGAEPRELPGRPQGRCWPGIDFLGPDAPFVAGDAAEVARSDAARQWVARRVLTTLLDREPDTGTVGFWATSVTGPFASEALLVGVLSSEEYVAQQG